MFVLFINWLLLSGLDAWGWQVADPNWQREG